jgi:hypothetical protein
MKTTRHSFFPSLNFSSLFSHLPLSSLFLTSLTLLFATAAQAQVPSYVPTNGLVGYWPFNGNANDESGNGNNGTVNGATLTADRFGEANKAYNFDGVSNFISMSNAPFTTYPFSISGWIFCNNNSGANHIIGLGELVGPTNKRLFFNGRAQIGSSGMNDISTSSNITTLGNWHHLVVVINNYDVNSVFFYLDGSLLAGNTTAGANIPFPLNNSGFTIGKHVGDFANGMIDDIGLWNRLLTAEEVLALYNGCYVTSVAIVGSNTPSAFATSTYTCNNNAGSTYTWAVNNGVVVSGQGTNSVTILWGAEGVGSVTVAETTADGCVGDEVIYDVNVQCVVSGNTITGPVGPEAFSNSTYTCNGAVNSTYDWTVTNGVIASGQGTNTVNILWASTGLGNVSVVETTAEGCVGTTLSQDVVVIPVNVEELSNQMLLYPNPATTELNLQITSNLIGTDLFVFDALGKQILKQQILSTNTTINTSSFAAGNYVVKVGGVVKRFEVKK